MSEKEIPRCIFLPPQGRPRWMPKNPEGWELLYLSWGLRWMGDNPLQSAMHDGWVYAVVMEGTPTLLVGGIEQKIKPGAVVIVHPDCAYGWTDRRGRSCRLLSWLWRTPPSPLSLHPPPGGYLMINVDKKGLSKLSSINKECSEAVAVPGETSFWILRRARLDCDILLLKRQDKVDPHYRMNLAVQFIRHNPGELQLAKRLCEYLQVSPTTLRVLFRKHFGRSPQEYALEQRMKLAEKYLCSKNCSVKEIAYQLGYKHANDFSRAYKRFFGRLAHSAGVSSK